MNKIICALGAVLLLSVSSTPLFATETVAKPVFKANQTLTMRKVFEQALERFPTRNKLAALEQEAQAFKERGDSLIAAAPSLSLRYQDDRAYDNAGLVEYEAGLQLPIWRWGQRSAGKSLGQAAIEKAASYGGRLEYEVAERLRTVIWNLRLKQNDVVWGHENYKVSAKQVSAVRRRVELGGLARGDLLLAESDLMAKQSLLERVVTELEIARRSYRSLTGFESLPANIEEPLNESSEISMSHPLLRLKQNEIRQREAMLGWIRSSGAGQPVLTLGMRSERSDNQTDSVDSLGAAINIPFGGRVYKAPKIAAANSKLIQSRGEYELLLRRLNQQFYATSKRVAMDSRNLQLARSRQEISKRYLKMSQLGFEAGEIGLFDLLKIQENAQQAALDSFRQKIILQRDIARHNQIVGLLP